MRNHTMKTNERSTLYFYQGNHLQMHVQDSQSRNIFRFKELALAETQPHQQSRSKLLAIDSKGSVVHAQNDKFAQAFTYNAYGHDSAAKEAASLLRFNGEYPEPNTHNYLLGNGYRAYSTVMMRFQGPDNQSPFNEGGLNAYAYCNGDPMNLADPSGHSPLSSFFKGIGNMLHLRKRGTASSMAPGPSRLPREVGSLAGMASDPISHSGGRPRVLPEYSRELPKNHKSQEKSRDLLREDARKLENQAHRVEIGAKRLLLMKVAKPRLKGEKVPESSLKKVRALREQQDLLSGQARKIRNSPAVSPPPAYFN